MEENETSKAAVHDFALNKEVGLIGSIQRERGFGFIINPEKKTKYYFHVSKMVDPEQFSSLQVRDVVEYVPMERDLTRERFKCGEAYFVEKSSAKINNFYLNLKGGK